MQTSPTDLCVLSADRECKLGEVEFEDLVRGFIGALFISLPLLYTQEMWTIALSLSHQVLLLWVGAGYLLCTGYLRFAGYRADSQGKHVFSGAFVCMGLGFTASLITLLLIGRWDFDDSVESIIRLATLEMVPTAMGAAIAINQLGAGDSSNEREVIKKMQPDLRLVLGSLLGSVLFVINIAPTVETQVIAYSITWWHVLGIVLFSLVVSYATVFMANIKETQGGEILQAQWVQTVASYLLALIASYGLLALYGYITPEVPFSLQLIWTIVLGYGTTLAGAAGRLIL